MNRLNAVLSKIEEVTTNGYGKVLGIFNKDVVADFAKDYQRSIEELEKKEWKQVTKSFSAQSSQLVKQRLRLEKLDMS